MINTVPSVQLFGGPFNTNESQFQNFSSGGNFSDPDPQDWTVTVDYGDGTGMHTLSLFNVQPGHNPTAQFSLNHAYRDNGVFALTVTVDDHSGGWAPPQPGDGEQRRAAGVAADDTTDDTIGFSHSTRVLLIAHPLFVPGA